MVRPVKHKKDMKDFVHECVGYIRVSTKSQAEMGESLDTQRKMILDYCKDPKNKCHLDPVRIYVDEGRSAFRHHNQRTGYQNAKKDIEKGRADTLIVYSLSRAFRSVRECIDTMGLLEEHNAHIISVTENSVNTTTKTGRFVYYLFGIMAQFESEQLSERIRDNLLHHFEETGYCGQRKPIGYKFVKEWKDGVKNGITQKFLKVVRPYYIKEDNGQREATDKVFEMYRKGYGQRLIQKETGLTLSVISYVLSSPLYCGYLLWVSKNGEHRIKKGEHKPYITREEFNKNVDRRIKRNKGDYWKRAKNNPPYKLFLKKGKPYLHFLEKDEKN